MCYTLKTAYLVVCEGKSENTYLKELSRYLENNDYSFTFVPKPIGSGHCTQTLRRYNQEKRKSPKNNIIIWVDKDTYIRNDNNDKDNYERSKKQSLFLFSYYNFEDFLVMHLNEEKVLHWQRICDQQGHFQRPLYSEQVEKLIKQHIFPDYQKGQIPFEITEDHITNLVMNQNNPAIKFKSDFIEKFFIKTHQ